MTLMNRPGSLPGRMGFALFGFLAGSVVHAAERTDADRLAAAGHAGAAAPVSPGEYAAPLKLGTLPAGFSVVESGGSTSVTEGGVTDSYTVVLNAPPAATVTVSLAFNAAQLTLNGDTDGSLSLEFTAGNWSEPQTVNIVAVDDTLLEGPHTSTIVQSASSADAAYASIDPADVTVSIVDNDSAVLSFSSAGFNVVEGALFSPGVRLSINANGTPGGSLSAPITASLVLTPGTASADDVALGVGSFTFPAGSTHNSVSTAASVLVTNDRLVEAIETFSLAIVIDSGVATTTALNTYQILSDDTAAITFSTASSPVAEGAGSAAVAATVTVSGSGSGEPGLGTDIAVGVIDVPQTATTPADYQVLTPSLVFPAGSASGALQNVEVAIVNDALVEGSHDFRLDFGAIATSATGVTASGSHTLTVFDDDFAGVSLTESAGSTIVTEGGANDSFALELTAQPTSDVTISFDVGTQVSFAPNPLVIAPADWNVPQTVTVTAIDDLLIEGPHSATVGLIFTGDADFAAITPNSIGLIVDIVDNDVPGVLVLESDGSSTASEGGAGDSYTVQLQSAPTQDVIIAIQADAQLQVAPVVLSFTPANWGTPQTVSINAVDDALIEGPHAGTLTHAATSLDLNYNGIAIAPVTVALLDNDVAGVTLLASGGDTTISEGGSGDSFTVQLSAQPASDVTISFNAGTQLSLAPASLVFTPAQWNLPQTVSVSAIDDAIIEGPHGASIGLSFAGDADFAAITPGSISVPVSIVDNDAAGVSLIASGGATTVSEGGSGDSFTVQLSAQPASDVSISFDAGAELSIAPSPLVISPAQWSQAQTVSVTAVDDDIAQGARTMDVVLGFSGDADFAAIPAGSVRLTVTIGDNDSAGIVLVESGGGSQAVEGGAGDDYTLRLQTQPTAQVQIAIDGGDQLQVSPALVSFTAANWNLPQTVTVNAVDDGRIEGPHSGSVSHAVSSADPAYDGLVLAALPVFIIDNLQQIQPRQIPASRDASLALLAVLIGLLAAVSLRRRGG
jgi:hypothetical protein